MKKISLLIAAAVSCACIMACNNAPEEPVEDTIVEETPVVEAPAPIDTVVEAVAEPAPAPTKVAATPAKAEDGVATASVSDPTTKVNTSKAPAKVSGVNKTTTTVDNSTQNTPTAAPTKAPAKVKM